MAELRNGDRPDGKQIVRHLGSVFAALPQCIQTIFARVAGYGARSARFSRS